MNALDLLSKVDDLTYVPKLDRGMRMLFVGRSGSGKSNAEVSFPKPLYTFDMDNRFKGATSALKWIGIEGFKQIEFDYYNPKDGFDTLDNKLSDIQVAAETRKAKFKTLCFDSVGTLIFMLGLGSQQLRGATKGDITGKVRGKVQFLHPDDYNYISTGLRMIMYHRIFALNEMGINTIFSAWVADRWAKKVGAGAYDPPEVVGEKILGPGNAVEEFIGYFDEVYYFRKESSIVEGKAPKYTVEFNGALAKSGLGLPPGRFDISNCNFFDFWVGKVNESMKG
jgi:hypothetical protein